MAQSDGLGCERDGGSDGEELPEEHERVEPPPLEDQDAAAEEADGGEEDVLVP